MDYTYWEVRLISGDNEELKEERDSDSECCKFKAYYAVLDT